MKGCSFALAALCASRALGNPLLYGRATCSPLEIIIARGTTEPLNPTYGLVVGDPLIAATEALIPGVSGYPVNYPATLNCTSRYDGGKDTVDHLKSQSAKCPSQKYVLVGYSQGGDVMHIAAKTIPTSLFPRIVGLVMVGEPSNRGPKELNPLGPMPPGFPPALAGKLKEICAHDDPVCTNNGTSIPVHLAYNDPGTTFIADAASYIQKQYQTNGKAGAQCPPEGPGKQTDANRAAIGALVDFLGGGPVCTK